MSSGKLARPIRLVLEPGRKFYLNKSAHQWSLRGTPRSQATASPSRKVVGDGSTARRQGRYPVTVRKLLVGVLIRQYLAWGKAQDLVAPGSHSA